MWGRSFFVATLLVALTNIHAKAETAHEYSLTHAESILYSSETSQQRAEAYMSLADIYFVRDKWPKAFMYLVLAMANHPSLSGNEKARRYIKKVTGHDISLLQPREDLLKQLNAAMEENSNPKQLRGLFQVATVVGLLPDYPLRSDGSDVKAPLQLCLAFDETYAKHGAVTLLSAMLSAAPSTSYTFNVFWDEKAPIREKTKKRLLRLVHSLEGKDGRFQIRFIQIRPESLPDELPQPKDFWTNNIYCKLMIPHIFEPGARVLYIDSDIIVRHYLGGIIEADTQGKPLLGVRDVNADQHIGRLGLDPTSQYINGGVVLFDNANTNPQEIKGAFRRVFDEGPGFLEGLLQKEQDLLALVYQGHITEIEKQSGPPQGSEVTNCTWDWNYQHHPRNAWPVVHSHFAKVIHLMGKNEKPWINRKPLRNWIRKPKSNDGVQNLYWALRDMGP